MAWSIKYSEGALKSLKKLDSQVAQRVLVFFKEKIEPHEDPRHIGEPLKGRLKDYWKYRIGSYRVICDIVDTEVVVQVLYIDHRKQVYKEK